MHQTVTDGLGATSEVFFSIDPISWGMMIFPFFFLGITQWIFFNDFQMLRFWWECYGMIIISWFQLWFPRKNDLNDFNMNVCWIFSIFSHLFGRSASEETSELLPVSTGRAPLFLGWFGRQDGRRWSVHLRDRAEHWKANDSSRLQLATSSQTIAVPIYGCVWK